MFKSLKKKLSKKDALLKAELLYSRQEKCEDDINRKLTDWGLEEKERTEIITTLIKNSFIDNLRYSKAFVREKSTLGKWGRIKIEFALKQKKISLEHINLALEEINIEKYDSILEKELKSKLKSIKSTDKYTIKSKLIRFGISRGYENGKVFDMVNKILKDSD
ncbi:MAG: regulatory protein RecX [Bacteroidales bacterium]|jgi:regulatory protein|nr:regulatory protein RecX [Bacteroidales bacterium]